MENKNWLMVLWTCILVVSTSCCISTPKKYFYLEGYLSYDQFLDVDNIVIELEVNNITIKDIINDYNEWTSEKSDGKVVKGFSNFSNILFFYKIFVNLSLYPLPESSVYKPTNDSLMVIVEGTIKNSVYDDGFNSRHNDHWVNLYINNLGSKKTIVTKWKPIMEKELSYIKQLIYNVTNLIPKEEKIDIETENWD